MVKKALKFAPSHSLTTNVFEANVTKHMEQKLEETS